MKFLYGATLRYIFATGLIAFIYYSLFLAEKWFNATDILVIPPMLAGASLATLLLFGIPAWLGIALGSGFANWYHDISLLYNTTATAGLVIEIVIASMILRPRLDYDFARGQDVVWFATVVWLIAPSLGAIITHIPFLISPEMPFNYIVKLCLTTAFTQAISLFTLTPFLLVWRELPLIDPQHPWRHRLEWFTLLLCMVGLSSAVLGTTGELRLFAIALLFPLILWAVIRFEQHGATLAILSVTTLLLNCDSFYVYNHPISYFGIGDILLEATLIAATTLSLFTFAALWTERRQQLQNLVREKQLATTTLHSIADGVLTTDIFGKINYLNPIAIELTGWTLEQALHKNAGEVFQIKSLDSASEMPYLIEHSLQGVINPPQQCLLVNREHLEKVIETSAAPIVGTKKHIEGVIVIFHDISKEHSLREQLTHQACHDALTGLYNRREFEFRLNTLINTAKNTNQSHSLLYLDLDQFKVVNDTCGHLAGDALLKQLVTVIQARVRGDDTFARLGGDEFAIILKNCPIQRAGGVATSFLNTVHDFRFVWEDKTFEIGVSIGVIPINTQSGDLATVLNKADLACYGAKEAGRNCVYVLDDNDKNITVKQSEVHWTTLILKAIEEQRLVIYRQPIISLQHAENEINYELLIRMKDERGAIILPGSFLPAAERYNLIIQIDKWVIHKVLTHLAQNPPHQKATGFFSINLSAACLNDTTFLQFIQNEVRQLTVPTHLICFELTETAIVSSLDKASHFMREMSKLGFRFALDNFGSGFSSFGYLKQLPIEFLKIDGKCVRDMMTDSVDRVIVESMHLIGHEMHIKTVAEWVENDTTRLILQQIGVDFVQGFGVGKPEPFL